MFVLHNQHVINYVHKIGISYSKLHTSKFNPRIEDITIVWIYILLNTIEDTWNFNTVYYTIHIWWPVYTIESG